MAIQAAKKGAKVFANDLNPTAVEYMKVSKGTGMKAYNLERTGRKRCPPQARVQEAGWV